MEGLNTLVFKYIFSFLFGFFTALISAVAQGNCLIYPADSGERIACELSYRALEYPQGSHDSQILFDAAIRIGPKYAWAYYEKSVPFFKRGMLAEGIQLINQAIEIDPKQYLYYRAYWYFSHRSFEACISDLEDLYLNHGATYSSTPGGDMEMRLLLAMAHGQIGNLDSGIKWVESLLDSYDGNKHLQGLYDYHILGILYYSKGLLDKAREAFEQQIASNPSFADTYFYLGLLSESAGDFAEARLNFKLAHDKSRGLQGGYSVNIFEGYNVGQEDFEEKDNAFSTSN